jgi:type I restriction enzyme R subunit
MIPFTEDILLQQTTADYLEHQLGWKSFSADNKQEVKT